MAKTQNPLSQLDSILKEYLVKKAPALPDNIKELIVNLAPWGSVIMIVVALPALFAVFQISRYTNTLMEYTGVRYGTLYYVALAFLAITAVLRGLSIPGLFSRKAQGWKYLYYATLINLVYSLLHYNVLGGILGAAISLYILYQVKTYYK